MKVEVREIIGKTKEYEANKVENPAVSNQLIGGCKGEEDNGMDM